MTPGPTWLQTGWATHQGRRPINEDAVLVDGGLLAVADGVGGAPRGDLAAGEAVSAVRDAVDAPGLEPGAPAAASELTAALLLADDAVEALADRWTELRGAATTMCAAIVFMTDDGEPKAVVANIGDSRCYHLRRGHATQITTDQTLANQLRQRGRTDVGGRADHIVTSILGGGPTTETTIHLYRLDLRPGDHLLLCTDGVSGVLEPDELVRRCEEHEPSTAAAKLVRSAWDAGSTDNLTVALATIDHELGEETPER
ncbi:MAG: protein phosphatase 2C domain-containing protein [Actinomycetota bacterium]